MKQHAEAMEEMNSLRRKMRSEAGASITFALLLFMVCAVLSGVIIVAATTASGRMDQIAESDQRYYAVTSAAELLKDTLDGRIVTVKSIATSETTNTVVNGTETEGTPVPVSGSPNVSIWYDDNEPSAAPLGSGDAVKTLSVLGYAAYRIAEENDANLFDVSSEMSLDTSLALTANVTDTTDTTIKDVFNVNILAQAKPDEDALVFYISKSDAKGNSYTLKASFKADVKTNVDEQSNTGTPTDVGNGGKDYKVITKKTTTTVTRMEWTLTDIVKATYPKDDSE